MKITINHETRYSYGTAAKHSIQLLRVTPQSFLGQRVLSWRLTVPHLGSEFFDGFGNYCTLMSIHEPHESLLIQADGIVEIDPNRKYIEDRRTPAAVFLKPTPLTSCSEDIYALAQQFLDAGKSRQALEQFSAAILDKMPYTMGSTQVNTTAAEAFELGKGVCQDHTHVFLAGARAFGIPSRYVSGYLYTDSLHHLASHAWAEAYLDGKWYVFDVSNQIFTPSLHVQIAVGLDYNDAAPVRGVRVGGGPERLDYHVQVQSDQ